ncbi:uncharacterized protein LOC108917757 [Anoplophora glabripennis]|uniref:uncharacterized protein LOC108917757 n=1 Tax=Anoplophora glabripennis TaxID=217634 RepID=UPI0008750742|nr:uncharacterized protein LOC108917757 [Anoplophora glabripennis]
MLKWTVIPRRDAEKPDASRPLSPTCRTDAKLTTPKSKSKRRRSSTARRSSLHKRSSLDALEADKENQFTSTPIKSSDNFLQLEALRDVSNLTPTDKRRIPSAKKCKSDRKHAAPATSPRLQHKKKKRCRNSHGIDANSQCSNYFKPFETVDSHIEGILNDEACNCKRTSGSCIKRVPDIYAPTLPMIYTPCPLRTPLCRNGASLQPLAKALEEESIPPNKKPKIDHINDFLQQITHVSSPETSNLQFPGLILNSTTKIFPKELKVSPLVKKFLDLKFNKVSVDSRLETNSNDSSLINDMSLDKIVDAILDTTDDSIRPTVRRALNTSLIVNVNENDLNETREHEQKTFGVENVSENSSDSGFRSSTTENRHQLDINFICKCNNNNREKIIDSNIPIDKTLIPIDETFNERCVDEDLSSRKRPSSTVLDCETNSKRVFLDKSLGETTNFTLKRQKCIRRRRTDEMRKMKCYSAGKNSVFCEIGNSSYSSSKIMDFESTPLRNCYLENKEIGADTLVMETPMEEFRGIRRCLLFDSPKTNDSTSLSESTSTTRSGIIDVRGSIDLKINSEDDVIFINVIRCKDLYRPNGEKINAYVKVALSDRLGDSRRKRHAVLQRTAVQGDSARPHFNHTFRIPAAAGGGDVQKRIHVEVWHRDRTTRTSEFLGCTSFDVRDAIDTGFSGSYRLLPQSTGRCTHVPITQDAATTDVQTDAKMCESQSSVDELMSLEDLENDLKKSTCKSVLSEQQKYADENLFLRYLELDPTEGPDATSAATQRKATGNRNGRTPFTCTKRLIRPPKSGFGFSVVWTHPPRIERVEKGLPAERAGILPGDYIIFVDKHNVVMMPEIDILNLIRSYGSQLTLEIFRRNPSRNGSVPSVKRVSTPLATSGTLGSSSILPVTSVTSSSNLVQRRPSTVCSTNTTSVDYSRRKLHLPQVTFSAEKPTSNPDENRKKAMYQLISKEQQYATGLQFAIARFVSALAERKDLITPSEHRILFQNCEEILRITEDILDHLVQEDGEPQLHHLTRTYHLKLHEITSAYKRYCSGIKKADCILANKTKNSNSDFTRFLQVPQIPRRRPDITTFIHKPLEHYRDMLRLLMTVQNNTKPNHDDFPVITQVVHDLQLTYREITSEAGLMEPVGEGRPLLTVQDLENRLVFTKCKPFVLNKPGRQWIFGGDLGRVEGRNVRQYWTLLFSDLLLFAKASRDRVLFVIEEPLPLAHITDMFFNVRKKDTEFRITINPEGAKAQSPTVHCGPDLTRTPRKNANKKTVILRAPTLELKAVWQNLLQRQIFHLNSGMDGSSVSSPLESPDAPITSSVVTLQSAESLTLQRRQTPQNLNQNCQNESKEIQKQIDALIEHKCKQLCKTSFNSKCNAVHLEQWMKGQLDGQTRACETPEMEPVYEEWTEEMLRKRSEELMLIDAQGNVTCSAMDVRRSESRCEEMLSDADQSPSKSTTTESQVTVRSSPLMPETVPVCRQCHKNCLSSNATANGSIKTYSDCNNSGENVKTSEPKIDNRTDSEGNEWQPLVLLGLMANPVTSLLKMDPFSTPLPKISVVPATPESSIKTSSTENRNRQDPLQCQNLKHFDLCNDVDNSPDDSPQTEEHPYHSLSSSIATLRRFGTVSSLERFGSEGHEDAWENNISSESEEDEEEDEEKLEEEEEMYERSYRGGVDNEAFNPSAIRHWTVRAGTFVAEKMAFFEKLGEDYRSGGFFDRYLRSADKAVNGEDQQEDETSGATSGEEIWGTPTSGEDLDDTPNSPNYEGKQSPNDGSLSSDFGDDTEIMMDELLMTPPISGAVMRGLLPRRTLEPLIEEGSETSSSSSIDPPTEPSVSPEQGSGTGDAADTCSGAAASPAGSDPPPPASPTAGYDAPETTPSPPADTISTPTEPAPTKIHRSESYRRIIEAAENADDDAAESTFFFNRFKPTAKFVNIERVPRSKSVKIFEFFNVRKPERRIYETFPEGRHLIKVFSAEDSETDSIHSSYSPKQLSPRRLKDKQLDRRFWKQLSRRRGSKVNVPA